jgi:D-tyrosyl-tRNA(Tyr) deacylase
VGFELVGGVNSGLLVYVAFHQEDQAKDLEWIAKKIVGLRIFDDKNDRMNLPIAKEQSILVVSQFTLYGNLKKGYRPSFNKSAQPDVARGSYDGFLQILSREFKGRVESGRFGENMVVDVKEDGPVSIWLDSHDRTY